MRPLALREARGSLAGLLLLLQAGVEVLLLPIDVRLESVGVDERILRGAFLQPGVFVREAVEGSVRAEEDVDRERAQRLEAANVVV